MTSFEDQHLTAILVTLRSPLLLLHGHHINQVNVILDSSSHYALIQIQDTGVGIAVEQTQIFEAAIE